MSNLPGTSALLNPPAVPEPSVGAQRPQALITYAEGQVPPPSALYVGVNDLLELKTWSDFGGGFAAILDIRLLLPDGTIQIQQENVLNSGGRATTINTFKLAEGFLLSIAVRTTQNTLTRGSSYASVSILRTISAGSSLTLNLAKGYVTFFSPVAWPAIAPDFAGQRPGQMLIIPTSNPAAGADFLITVPAGVRWRIIGLRASLVTAVAVATREVVLAFGQTPIVIYAAICPATQAASLTTLYSWGAGVTTLLTVNGQTGLNASISIPNDLWLATPMTIASSTQNIQAADQWSNINMLVEECLDE